MKSINEELINILKDRVPKKVNSAEFLMDILSIGREAAYRRLRGDVQFTLDEATLICKELNISLDLLMGIQQVDKYAFHMNALLSEDSIDNYITMLGNILESMEIIKDEKLHLYSAHRTMPQAFLYNYELISKIFIYILQYQFNSQHAQTKKLSDIILPQEVFTAQKKSTLSVHNQNSTLILDKHIFFDYIEIVKYFESLGMISEAEIKTIKTELLCLIDDMENCAKTGKSLNGKLMNMYISHISFDCSYTCVDSEHFQVSSLGIYCVNYLTTESPILNKGQLTWIKSLIRFSTLISVANELMRNNFFNTQRTYVNTML